jgi:PilZ domain-containing protein
MSVAWYNSRVLARDADWVQRRKNERRPVNLMAVILAEGDGTAICQCTMADISQGGTKLIVEQPSLIPESFVLVLSRGARIHRKCKVRWRSEIAIGVEFIRN